MKRYVVFILVVTAAILAFIFFPSLTSIFNGILGVSAPETKCTTSAGTIFYGEVPEGVVCQKIESVDTSITVLKSSSQNSTESAIEFEGMKCDGRRYC